MSSGAWILLVILLLFILIAVIGFYCHFCGESGGRSFDTFASPKPRVVVFAKKKCTCDKRFKGLCKYCEVTDDFVGADGGVRVSKDYTDFGGDQGFDGGGQSGDPIRGFLGGGNQQQNNMQAQASSNANETTNLYDSAADNVFQ